MSFQSIMMNIGATINDYKRDLLEQILWLESVSR